mmetsp:Transcript_29150/g.49430  ORF Transcript_29150/g.49430 Transcript_29150/m.49430 type:complete len:464 (+) Transcript_29150:440-1831(+)
MLKAIQHCHSKGVVHRDIKPENFLFETTKPTSLLKLIDFGEAVRLIGEDQRIFNVAGSEYYLAPEVLPTDAASFRRTLREWKGADVWSIGVVLYVCLFGRPPFVGSDALATFRRIKRGEFKIPPVSYVSKNAIAFIKGVLRNSPDRMTVEQALAHPFLTSGELKEDPIPRHIHTALIKFKKHCKLKRVVGRVLADKMKKDDKETLKRIFREHDRNGDGMLDKRELTDLMRSIQTLDNDGVQQYKNRKYVYGKTEAEDLLHAQEQVRKDSEAITEEDFISMYAAHHVGRIQNKDELKRAFDSIDIDHDGFVTAEDLHTSCGFMTPKTCHAIAKESSDIKDKEKISFQAFIKAMRNTPSFSQVPSPKIKELHNASKKWSRQASPLMGSPMTPPAQDTGSGFFSTANALAGLGAPQIGGHGSVNSGSSTGRDTAPPSLQQHQQKEANISSVSNEDALNQPLLKSQQ